MSVDPAIAARASDALRSALIFLPDDGRVVAVDGGFAMLDPANPGYWWGNSLRLDRPPAGGDLERWRALFERTVRAAVPAARHTTFAWDGDDAGDVAPFVEAGFVSFEAAMLGADRGTTIAAPRPADVAIEPVEGLRWDALAALLETLREPNQAIDDHAAFVARRIANWRRLVGRGRGTWWSIADGDRIVAALGVFAEAERGRDGRRIGRYQEVVTDAGFRRRGYAGTLVARAARHAFEVLDVDTLLIGAGANGDPRRLYEACGFRLRSRHHGLELAG